MKLIGHNEQIDRLNRALVRGTVAQAYVFSGPDHVGKHTLATYFARAIIDGIAEIDFEQKKERDYYGDLISCAPIAEVQKIKNKKIVKKKKKARSQEKFVIRDISVDQVRKVIHEISLSSLHGTARVLIIDDADRMGRGAQNALLKTVEEPPHNAHVIFVTSDRSRLLPTIQSRCQNMVFSLLNDHSLHMISKDQQLCTLAMGRPGLLTKFLSDEKTKEIYLTDLCKNDVLITGSVTERLKYAEELAKDQEHARDVLIGLQWHMRQDARMNGSYDVYEKIKKIEQTRSLLRTNANARMVLEELFLI